MIIYFFTSITCKAVVIEIDLLSLLIKSYVATLDVGSNPACCLMMSQMCTKLSNHKDLSN